MIISVRSLPRTHSHEGLDRSRLEQEVNLIRVETAEDHGALAHTPILIILGDRQGTKTQRDLLDRKVTTRARIITMTGWRMVGKTFLKQLQPAIMVLPDQGPTPAHNHYQELGGTRPGREVTVVVPDCGPIPANDHHEDLRKARPGTELTPFRMQTTKDCDALVTQTPLTIILAIRVIRASGKKTHTRLRRRPDRDKAAGARMIVLRTSGKRDIIMQRPHCPRLWAQPMVILSARNGRQLGDHRPEKRSRRDR